jgi:hypothetical protein
MQEYLLKVGEGAKADIQRYLDLKAPTTHVRVATLAPLSNWGFPANSEGAVIKVLDRGLVTGQAGGDEAPHDFVPWANIAYLSDGSKLAKELAAEREAARTPPKV